MNLRIFYHFKGQGGIFDSLPDTLQFEELHIMDELMCDLAFPNQDVGITGEEICAYDEVNI